MGRLFVCALEVPLIEGNGVAAHVGLPIAFKKAKDYWRIR